MCVVVPNICLESGEFEGFGLVAVEAAAAGGIVLAARHAGLADAVIEGSTGFLLPPGDAASWSRKIREVANWTPERRAGFVLGSRETCARHFTWERVARETAKHYRADGTA
jgi:glycosyltransferase involved in cell wall biosynthesis